MAAKSKAQKEVFHEPAMKKHGEQFVSEIIIEQNSCIPEEIQFCILQNLPAKSLVRFKCINKSLNSIISDTNFINKTPHLILCTAFSIYLLNCQVSSVKAMKLNLPIKATKLNSPIKAETRSFLSVMASCNGILWMKVNDKNLLWNPFTGEHKIMANGPSHVGLQTPAFEGYGLGYGFGYDHTTKDYKIICIPTCYSPKPFIYSVKNDSYESLEGIIPDSYFYAMFFYRKEGLLMKNGGLICWPVIYCCSQTIELYTERNNNCAFCHEGRSKEMHLFILEFDVVNRKQILIPQPLIAYNPGDDMNSKMVRKLVDFEGSLCAAIGDWMKGITDLWLLKEDKYKQNWVKFISIDFNNPDFYALPMYIKSDEEVVMSNIIQGKIVCYDRNHPTESRFRSAKIDGVVQWYQEITYTQTLVSIQSQG